MSRRTIFRLWFLLLAVGPACAQQNAKFSIVSFGIDQLDMTAQNPQYEKIDGNGSRYAIVKVTSDNPDDELRSYNFNFHNLKSIIELHDNELWVYVQKNAKIVTITREGYHPVNRYDLRTTIEEGRTYVMRLSSKGPMVLKQMVQFVVKPASAGGAIMIKRDKDDAQEELFGTVDETGQVARSLAYGTYTYKVHTTGGDYHSSEGRFTLDDRTQTHVETISLRPNFSIVTLNVADNADIYIDGERKGKGTWTGRLKSGTYQVVCQQEQHRPSSQYITIEENNDHTIELTPPEPVTGILAITSQPLGADIIIDGKDYGKTPQTISKIIIGHHQVTIRKEQHREENLSFEIEEGETTEIDVEMKDITTKTIESQPSGANLYLNGKKVGTTPYTDNLPAGEYEILLTRTNYQDFRQNVVLDRNNPMVSYSLKRLKMLPSCAYLQVGLQAGSFMAMTGTAGFYTSNFNVEASYLKGLKKSEEIFWNYTGEDDKKPQILTYSSHSLGAKAGYGIIIGTYIRCTPQVGASLLTVKSSGNEMKGYAISANVGVRGEYALQPNLGVYIAPEMEFPVNKSAVYERLANVSSKIKNWGSGFNVRLGLIVSF